MEEHHAYGIDGKHLDGRISREPEGSPGHLRALDIANPPALPVLPEDHRPVQQLGPLTSCIV